MATLIKLKLPEAYFLYHNLTPQKPCNKDREL